MDDLVYKLLKDAGRFALITERLYPCEEESVTEWLWLDIVYVIEMNEVLAGKELLSLDTLSESLVNML